MALLCKTWGKAILPNVYLINKFIVKPMDSNNTLRDPVRIE